MQNVHECHDSLLGELAAELAPGENTWLPVPDSQRHWKYLEINGNQDSICQYCQCCMDST